MGSTIENLKDANGFNADLGYRGSLFDFINFDINFFYIKYNNRIGTIRQYIDNDPTKATFQYRTNLGKSANKSVEAFIDLSINRALKINKKIGEVNLFVSLAFINAEYDDF